MSNLMKLSAFAGLCFAMIVIGACGGGDGGGGGHYSGGINPACTQYFQRGAVGGGTAYASCTSTSTSTSVTGQFTVTNGLTYYHTGTDTFWHLYTGTTTSTQ